MNKIKMKELLFGTSKNIHMKFIISFFLCGVIFMFLRTMIEEVNNPAQTMMFILCGISFSVFLIGINGPDTGLRIMLKVVALAAFWVGLILSLNFFVNTAPYIKGWNLLWKSIGYEIILAFSTIYWTSKCIDLFSVVKDLFGKFKKMLFDHEGENSIKTIDRIQALLENMTAFLVSLTGFGLALKGIIIPTIQFFFK